MREQPRERNESTRTILNLRFSTLTVTAINFPCDDDDGTNFQHASEAGGREKRAREGQKLLLKLLDERKINFSRYLLVSFGDKQTKGGIFPDDLTAFRDFTAWQTSCLLSMHGTKGQERHSDRNDSKCEASSAACKETLGGMRNLILFSSMPPVDVVVRSDCHLRLHSSPLASMSKHDTHKKVVFVYLCCYCTIENKTITEQINSEISIGPLRKNPEDGNQQK